MSSYWTNLHNSKPINILIMPRGAGKRYGQSLIVWRNNQRTNPVANYVEDVADE